MPKFEDMNMSLKGKNALVCGSSQGIGLAIAKELAGLGANCILLARNQSSLEAAVQELPVTEDQSHSYRVADFSDSGTVNDAVRKLVSEKTIHILINNSGGPASGSIVDATPEQFLSTFQQHLICNQLLTTAVINGMKEAHYGRIVNVISTSVKIPLKNLGVSNTIRGAVASWAKTMANELGQFNITVNNVLPGATKTKRLESIVENSAKSKGLDTAEIEKEMSNEIPMKRFGEASEIAAVAAFLASPAASYVNGVSIPVDGGRTGAI